MKKTVVIILFLAGSFSSFDLAHDKFIAFKDKDPK